MIVVSAFIHYDYGMVKKLMVNLGLVDKGVDFYQQRGLWPYLLVFINAWKGVGYQTVLYLAVISGISHEYYEAAVLDGASKWQQAKYITVPMLQSMIILMFIRAVGGIFSSDFGLFYQATRGAQQPLTPIVATFDVKIYQMLTNGKINVGKTSAASMFQSVIGCAMILTANAVVRKVDPDSAMI